MELKLERETFTSQSTIGSLFCGGVFLCHILEDTDRGLTSGMALGEIQTKKVYGKTAIPRGRYQIVATMSQRFAKILPLLLKVPGFEGIRIHPGNTPADTDGCLLPGLTGAKDFVGSSRDAFSVVDKLIHRALDRGDEVWITIQ